MKYVEKLLPKYAVVSLIFCFAWSCFVYWSTQFLCADREHFDLTTDFDRWVPVQSWWVLIYVASFLFWGICYIFIARLNEREFWFRFVTADLLSRTLCGVIFIILPTTNVRPVFYCICGVIRLAYFNVIETNNFFSEEEHEKVYYGLPITSIAVILPLIYLLSMPLTEKAFSHVLLIMLLAVGMLFISNFKMKKPSNKVLFAICAVVACALLFMLFLKSEQYGGFLRV